MRIEIRPLIHSFARALLVSAVVVSVATTTANADSPAKTRNHRAAVLNSAALDRTLNYLLARHQIPGMAIGVVARSKRPVFWSRGYGVTSLHEGTKVTPDTPFWLGSASKLVTGAVVMKAQEQSLIDLDSPLEPVLGNVGGIQLPKQLDGLSLRHLVTHTGSVFDAPEGYVCAYTYDDENGQSHYLADLAGLPHECPSHGPLEMGPYLQAYLNSGGVYFDADANFINKAPGDVTEYSNIGAALAAHVVELQSGTELAEYANQMLFQPLGLGNTSWSLEDFDAANLAFGHKLIQGQLVTLPQYRLATKADGGLRSSANDMLRFLATMLNDGRLGKRNNTRVLSAASTQTLLGTTEGVSNVGTSGHTVLWGKGVARDWRGDYYPVVGHSGRDPGFQSYAFVSPELDIGFVILLNASEVDESFLLGLHAFLMSAAQMLR